MLKYVNTSVVCQEIPDEITLAINISNCPCRCPGCHSRYLWTDTGEPLTTRELDKLVAIYGQDITCVGFMGGDAESGEVVELARYVRESYPTFKVAWYSGRSLVPSSVDKRCFDYIKTGPYLRHLGALDSVTTNQRLYKVEVDGGLKDITERFWKK